MIRQALIFTLIICVLGTLAISKEKKKLYYALQSYDSFAVDLYPKLAREEKDSNLVCTPLSAHLLLSLAAYGSIGETRQQLNTGLHLNGIVGKVLAGYRQLQKKLTNVENATLHLANKVYVSKSLRLTPDYEKAVNHVVPSGLSKLDQDPSKAVEIINNWAADQTKQKIQGLLNDGDIDSDTKLVLLNAIYFKANWATEFDKEKTDLRHFTTLDGAVHDVSMMHVKNKFNISIDNDLDAVFIELPYKNNDLKMVIAVPNNFDGLPRLEQQLKNYDYKHLPHYNIEVELSLPKFKIESKINFVTALQQLGMSKLFSRSAEFDKISKDHLKVGQIVQKAFISVDEEGAEAAAVTELDFTFRSLPADPFILNVDKPFYFAIKYLETTLFEGHVVNPQA